MKRIYFACALLLGSGSLNAMDVKQVSQQKVQRDRLAEDPALLKVLQEWRETQDAAHALLELQKSASKPIHATRSQSNTPYGFYATVKAAHAGDGVAMFRLGAYYSKGFGGAKQSASLSNYWYVRARALARGPKKA